MVLRFMPLPKVGIWSLFSGTTRDRSTRSMEPYLWENGFVRFVTDKVIPACKGRDADFSVWQLPWGHSTCPGGAMEWDARIRLRNTFPALFNERFSDSQFSKAVQLYKEAVGHLPTIYVGAVDIFADLHDLRLRSGIAAVIAAVVDAWKPIIDAGCPIVIDASGPHAPVQDNMRTLSREIIPELLKLGVPHVGVETKVSPGDELLALGDRVQNYIILSTWRKSGGPVSAPSWGMAQDSDVRTAGSSVTCLVSSWNSADIQSALRNGNHVALSMYDRWTKTSVLALAGLIGAASAGTAVNASQVSQLTQP